MLLIALPLLAVAHGLDGDATALLQTSGRTLVQSRTQAVERMLYSARGLLLQGATPEVLEFTENALNAIKAEVLPALERDHRAQVSLLDTHYKMLEQFISDHLERLASLSQARDAEKNLGLEHVECRGKQQALCRTLQDADQELSARWERVTDEEESLLDVTETITTQWCAPATNTSNGEFREKSSKKFEKFVHKRGVVREAWKEYNAQIPVCDAHQASMDELQSLCMPLQESLEQGACASHEEETHVRIVLDAEWPGLLGVYNETVEMTQAAETARKQEFTTLAVVGCLMDRIHERGGQPCDEATEPGAADEAVKTCHGLTVNTTALDITYLEVPPKPEPLATSPHVCSEEWRATYYGQISGCVELAACRACMPEI